jgi:hypothetical protein
VDWNIDHMPCTTERRSNRGHLLSLHRVVRPRLRQLLVHGYHRDGASLCLDHDRLHSHRRGLVPGMVARRVFEYVDGGIPHGCSWRSHDKLVGRVRRCRRRRRRRWACRWDELVGRVRRCRRRRRRRWACRWDRRRFVVLVGRIGRDLLAELEPLKLLRYCHLPEAISLTTSS